MAVQLQARLHISLCTYRCKPVTCVRTLQGTAVLCRNVSDRSYSTERGLGVMVAGRGPARVIGDRWRFRSASLPSFKGLRMRKSSFSPQPALPSTVAFELSRIMTPDDTNVAGNVHGGTILNSIERAGFIVSTRHCNSQVGNMEEPLTSALVRLEHMDFYKPMFVGEVARLQAAVSYTSSRSIEVTVDVWADNIVTGERRLTNTAHLWYVAIPANMLEQGAYQELRTHVRAVPQLKGLSKKQMEEGVKRYERQKSSRLKQSVNAETYSQYQDFSQTSRDAQPHTVLASQSTLANLVLPSDCNVYNHLTGGSLMKIMDNAATVCTEKHCMGRVVTACIDEINFNIPINSGQMVFVTARLVYTSNKSMEVEVTTEAEGLSNTRYVTNTAYFAFVSLGEDLSARPVPPLVLKSEEEKSRFQEGNKRYGTRKKIRMDTQTK